jgi:hypothetical protein
MEVLAGPSSYALLSACTNSAKVTMGAALTVVQQVHAKAGPPRGTPRGPMPLSPHVVYHRPCRDGASACARVNPVEAVFTPSRGSIVTGLKPAPTALAITPREYFSYSIGVRRSLR